jgi:succinate dehydrogenase / fumarate reductase, cytochrome b subunit
VSAQSDNHPRKSRGGSTLWRAFDASNHPMARAPARRTSDTISPMAGSSSFSRFQQYFSSSVGTKLLIGITGLLLFVYMILHLAGNALILAGADVFNEYSHRLIANPLIIPIELGLLAVFVIHIYKTVRMVIANRAARPIAYQKKAYAGHTSRKSFASSTMIASGLFLLVFVLIHVKQFKFGSYYQTVSASPIRDLYRTELEVFQNPLWVVFYVIGTTVVGLHLRHGIASGFQSIGADHPLYTRHLTTIGIVLAIIIGGGLGLIPIWVYLTH